MRQTRLHLARAVTAPGTANPVGEAPSEWADAAEGFRQYRRAQGKSERTREVDALQLGRLRKYVEREGIALADFTAGDAAGFIVELDERLTPRGINMTLQACSLLGDWLIEQGIWQANPFRHIRRRREVQGRQPKGLTKEELEALLAAPDRATASGLRDFLCLYLAAFVGLRVGEICHLRASDIDRDRCRVVIRGETAKTRVERMSWLPHAKDENGKRHLLPEFAKPLARWERTRDQFRLGPEGPLFCGVSRNQCHRDLGSSLEPRLLQQAIARYGRRAGIRRRVHMHQLRHTAGYLMGHGGLTGRRMTPQEIMDQLGHTTLLMALYYSKGTEEDTGDAFAATRHTEVVRVPTRERAKVIPPTDIAALLEAAGVLDARKVAKLRALLEEEDG